MPSLTHTIAETRTAIQKLREQHGLHSKVGFVPTMGALHRGHAALIEAARAENEIVVVSIFVNPTQFAPNEDLDKYPRTLDADQALCEQYGVDLIFHPTDREMYPADFCSYAEVTKVTESLEGAHRPSHFRGVTTVVLKLLNIVLADCAYFGQKDFQQQLVIRQMCQDLNVPVEIVNVPTWRDADGLALSSRNQFLSAEERQNALVLSAMLNKTRDRLLAQETDLARLINEAKTEIEKQELKPDYFSIASTKTLAPLTHPEPEMVLLVAAHAGNTRLIDNLLVTLPQ